MADSSIKRARLQKFFAAVCHGKRAIKSVSDAKLYLEAICEETERPRCIEKVVASECGLQALRTALRSDKSDSFLDHTSSNFFEYLADAQIKQLHNGQLLQEVLFTVIDPPTFWDALQRCQARRVLSIGATRGFAWLLFELLDMSQSPRELNIRKLAEDCKSSLLDSPDGATRNLAYKIQHVLQSTTIGIFRQDQPRPGGRHDNDFEDFRKIAIFPTADELTTEEQPFYRPAETIQEVRMEEREAVHLDNQFRLLHDEMKGELQSDLDIARGKKHGKRTSRRLVELVFHGIQTGKQQRRRPAAVAVRCYGGLHIPGDSSEQRRNYVRENRALLKHESFGCLLRSGEIIAFATIDRDEDLLAEPTPVVLLRVLGDSATAKALITLKTTHQRELEFVVVDTPYFAFEPVLRALQEKKSIPLSTELLNTGEGATLDPTPFCPSEIVQAIKQYEGKNLREVIGLDKDVILDHSQTQSIIAGLSQRVSLIQGPPGTGKSFLGALLAKVLFDETRETILIICYTNHALDQFLKDIQNIGVSSADMLRLGSKSTPETQHLSLKDKAATYRRSQESWDLFRHYTKDADDAAKSVQHQATQFRDLKISSDELLSFLQFSEKFVDFYDAFVVPELEENGMTMVGRGGKKLGSSYLIDRWLAGLDAGVFKSSLDKRHYDIWALDKKARSDYHGKWSKGLFQEHATVLHQSIGEYTRAYKKFCTVRDEKGGKVIQSNRIIGCTTSKAAAYTKEFENARPGIIIVEEAGEILESHILTSLCEATKHLILIGDHQQLRPKVNKFELTIEKGDGYDLNRSLFERLVLNGFPHTTLAKQHRMRPEISRLVKLLTYPNLEDDEKTHERPSIRGLQSNVVFFNHQHPEVDFDKIRDRRDEGTKGSRQNIFEAEIVLKTAKYLAQQGYGSEEQVVLTPYLGQLRLLLEYLSADHDPVLNDMDSHDLVKAGLIPPTIASAGKRKLRVSTIDNYQGEESDIVIASLTRSNSRGEVGFMAAPQRLNVLLSRARNGLIIIGNSATFLKNKKGRAIWEPLINQMREFEQFYDGLPVRCERHPEKTTILKRKEDFDTWCPDGGCSSPCDVILSCKKHACPQRCHALLDHSKVRCQRIVEKSCSVGHKYSWRCWEGLQSCSICEAEAERVEAQKKLDHELDVQRRMKEIAYAAELKKFDQQIARERSLQKYREEDEERERVLKQRVLDLAAARESSTKKNFKGTHKQHEATGNGPNPSSSQSKEVGETPNSEPHPTSTTGDRSASRLKQSQAASDWEFQKQHEMARNDHLDTLMSMIGLESVKQQFLDVKTRVDTCIRQSASLRSERFGAALLGNPGTGKTTVARCYAQFLASVGVIPGCAIEETTGARLAADGAKACDSLLQKIKNAGGGALFIDEAYQLVSASNPGGGQVLDFILAEVENLTGKVVFILAGYRKQMEDFFAHNPGLPSRFPHELQFQDYEDDELRHIFHYQLTKRFKGRMKLEEGPDGLFSRIVARRVGYSRGQEGFGNARAVENSLAKILARQAKRLLQERRAGQNPDDLLLTSQDLIGPEPSSTLADNKAWKELNSLVGLDTVKQSVQMLLDTIQYNYERELEEKPLVKFNLNKVFLGSPGTGKTTVAKLYGCILAQIGLLSKGEVVVKNPSDFVGDVLGGSEKLTKGILASTVGKVLVIDEAYGLNPGSGTAHGSDPFKNAVIDTIVAEVHSVPGDDRCVLLLGYKDQMESMFQNANPGFSRRFPIGEAFEFEDFTDDDLRKILDTKLQAQGYSATGQAKGAAMDCLRRARNQKHFGNAGAVDILLDTAKANHQKRRSKSGSKRDVMLEAIDFDPDFDRGNRAATNVRMLFSGEIGREEIIDQLEGYQRTVAAMKSRNMDPRTQIPFNFLFRGPPGTGKTTTARKIGKVYYDMGFLSTAEVHEISATSLIGEYVGHTGPKTQKELEKALGKVLFVDEAYRLAGSHFAKEAIDEIVDCMTKPAFAQKLLIILAGYDADIDRLMSINPGLTSRFPETMQFRSMESVECLNLLALKLAKDSGVGVDILTNPQDLFKKGILDRFDTLIRTENWGNARDVGILATLIFSDILKKADPDPTVKLVVEESTIIYRLDYLIAERTKREKSTSSHSGTSFNLPVRDADPQTSKPMPTTSTATTRSNPPAEEQQETEKPEALGSMPEDPTIPDPGVDEETWTQLQRDKQAALSKEAAIESEEQELAAEEQTLSALEKTGLEVKEDSSENHHDTIDAEARRRLEQDRLEREAERRKQFEEAERRRRELKKLRKEHERHRKEQEREQAVRQKLRHMGVCVQGYQWYRQGSGYRCAGGSHHITDSELGL